ncbi:MAG: ABC transporter substrate-binding protein [Gammaproteobacteria bacterium]|nr:ABC transporter substrate-binding protein [Gammaproteobacteria bacterium]
MSITKITATLRRLGALASVAVCFSVPFAGTAQAQVDEITVAYFLEWPTPNQVAQLEKIYDRELGVKVNWKSFSSGNDMSAAMASGDVHISYSQGLIPFIVATSKGLPIRMVGIAVAYAEADNCVVHNDSALDRSSPESIADSLRGKKIATPEGNVTHYKLLRTLDFYGLGQEDVEIIPMAGGQDAAAAFLTGRVDIGCAFGGPLDKMKETGQVIMTGAEQEDVGIFTFDVISVTDEFATNEPELLAKFMQVTEDTNKLFAADPEPHWDTLARASSLEVDGVKGYLGANGTFAFPNKDAQLSDAWMGGNVQSFTKDAADFFVNQGVMPAALASYDAVIDTSFLQRVK